MTWVVEFLNDEVKEALDDLPLDLRASFQRIVELIQSHGLERVREPYVKHLEGPLWEMRMKGRSGVVRAVYVTAVGKRRPWISSTRRQSKLRVRLSLMKAA
jgi:phage-related protein